jgi:hypothetical protein
MLTLTEETTFKLRERHQFTMLDDEVDPAAAGIDLKGPPCWADGSPKKLVWVEVATTGKFLGHASGPFEMTRETFDECVANHDKRGIAVQWDMEHISEADPTTVVGAADTGIPAQGWAHELRREGDSLYALTEWLDLARDGIKAGNFCFCSPALRLGSVDPVTGKPAGARLTSIAITGSPFLSNLEGLRAASDKTPIDVSIALRDAQANALSLATKLRDAESKRAAAEGLVETLHSRATTAESALSTAQKTAHDMVAAEAERVIQDRHLTYHSRKPMRIEAMRALYFASRSAFDDEFPEVSPERQYLLSTLVPSEPKPTQEPPTGPARFSGMHLLDIQIALTKEGMPWEEATEEAHRWFAK